MTAEDQIERIIAAHDALFHHVEALYRDLWFKTLVVGIIATVALILAFVAMVLS